VKGGGREEAGRFGEREGERRERGREGGREGGREEGRERRRGTVVCVEGEHPLRDGNAPLERMDGGRERHRDIGGGGGGGAGRAAPPPPPPAGGGGPPPPPAPSGRSRCSSQTTAQPLHVLLGRRKNHPEKSVP